MDAILTTVQRSALAATPPCCSSRSLPEQSSCSRSACPRLQPHCSIRCDVACSRSARTSAQQASVSDGLAERLRPLAALIGPRRDQERRRVSRLLIHAGYRSANASTLYYGAKGVAIVLLPLAVLLASPLFPTLTTQKLLLFAALAGYFGSLACSIWLDRAGGEAPACIACRLRRCARSAGRVRGVGTGPCARPATRCRRSCSQSSRAGRRAGAGECRDARGRRARRRSEEPVRSNRPG